MSELVTVSGSITGTIYGGFAAAGLYIGGSYGAAYTAWLALTTDAAKKQTLITAARYLDRQSWIEAYDTFAERDALAAFVTASYELGALIASDPGIVTKLDQGSNIQSVGAGGAQVTYFSPTSASRGSAPTLPPVIEALIGAFLSSVATSGPQAGSGVSGGCRNPLSDCVDFDRGEPY